MSQLPQLDKNYLTTQGDVLDKICWLFYGITDRTVKIVLERNPILNEYPSILPAGILLVLPTLNAEPSRQPLWDYVQPTQAQFTVDESQSEEQKLRDSLNQYQNTGDGTIYISAKVDRLYSPMASVTPILVGPQVPANLKTEPLPDIPSTNAESYVGIYYRGPNNTFRVGYISKDQLLAGAGIEDVLVSGLP